MSIFYNNIHNFKGELHRIRTMKEKISEFKFIMDSGQVIYVLASCRKKAIEQLSSHSSMNEEYIKQHSIIKNMGIVGYMHCVHEEY